MTELFKLIMAKPLQGIVAALMAAMIYMFLFVGDMQVAIAVINEQQVIDKQTNATVLRMNETLIRVDENLKIVKENQTAAYGLRNLQEN
tara:strand:- start:1193 stop:1459 length:267 start_codon:yes stop_codon:yes gene_type:complete